jgi:thiamine biosynthesis lipoprotein
MRISMGTLVAVEAANDSSAGAEAAIESAFGAVLAVDRRMHPRSAHSDLARINNSQPGSPVAVHRSICELLRFANRLGALTGGVFDPCLPHSPGRLPDIEILDDCTVLCHAAVSLDFGGFAKGYAADRAIEELIAHGCPAGLVNAGGDLRVFGPRVEPILVRGPGGELNPLALSDTAVAVSDADSQRQPAEHQGYYVRSNARSASLFARYAAVTAKEAVLADALVKCVLLCPEDVAGHALREFGAALLRC